MSAPDLIVRERGFVVEFVNWIFTDMLKYVLFTPFELFKNPAMIGILLKMSGISMAVVTVLTMIEGLKRTLSLSYTPMTQIAIRFPIAIVVSAIVPFIFYYTAIGVNELVSYMGLITGGAMEGNDVFVNHLTGLSNSIFMSVLTFFFLIALGFYLFKILLYHAYRWFGLMFNMLVTPFVMVSYIFKPFESILSMWTKDNIQKFFVQVAHSFMLGLIAIILYSPNMLPTGSAWQGMEYGIIKIMLAIGGLHMMLNPPGWVRGMMDSGANSLAPLKTIGRLARFALLKR